MTPEEKKVYNETQPAQQDMYTFSKKKKIIFVIATILLLFLAWSVSFNMRSLAARPQFMDMAGTKTPEFILERKYLWDDVFSKAQGADRFFLQLNTDFYRPANILQSYKALHEADPKNQIYLSYYAIYLAASNAKEARDIFEEVIVKWKALDPNNAMPYFLRAYVLSRDAIAVKKESAPTPAKKDGKAEDPDVKVKYEIKNQAAADLAIAEYKAGLDKKYATAYTDLAIKKKLASANLKRDPLGELHRLAITGSCLPVHLLIIEQDLSFRMAALAEILAEKGKVKEAAQLVRSGRKYIQFRLEKEPFNVLGFHPINNCWLETSRTINDKEMTAVYEGVAKIFDDWRNLNRPDQHALKKHGGVFMQLLAPTSKVEVATADYKPERMINYLILDQYKLATTFVFWSITIVVMAFICGVFFLCKRKARWIQLPIKSYAYIGVVGILLPLLIQLIWVHVPVLSGRDLSIFANQTHLSLLDKYQTFLSPIFFGILTCSILVKKGNAKPLDCIWNLVFLLTVYLFVTSAVLRGVQDAEISYYTKQDKLVHSESGFPVLSDRAVQELTGKIQQHLKKN